MISVGTLGLIQAFRNFDPERFDGKVKSFSTYAFPMIKWSIQKFLREKRYSVRIPRTIQDRVVTILKQGWADESPDTITKLSGWNSSDVEEAIKFLDGWSVASLDQPVNISEKDEVSLIELLPSTDDSSHIFVQEFVSYLSETEQMILRMRLEGYTQSDIAARVECSQVSISRILNRIGDKYIKFQKGELNREGSHVGRPRKQELPNDGIAVMNSIEWFIDESVPTNPTAGLNSNGIHFNRRAVHETGWKPGQCLQIGYEASSNRLIIRSAVNGVPLREISGDTAGALRVVNKRLSDWCKSKGFQMKRYALHTDPNGYYYIDFDA